MCLFSINILYKGSSLYEIYIKVPRLIKQSSNAFICETFTLYRGCYAFIREPFALICENVVLIRESDAFIREIFFYLRSKMTSKGFYTFVV